LTDVDTAIAPPVDPSTVPTGTPGLRRWQRFRRNKWAVAGLVILVLLVVMAIFAPFIAPHDPNRQDLLSILTGSTAKHPLGTDQYGRDVLSRLIYGARVSLVAAFEAVTIGVVVGVPLGFMAAYFEGPLDAMANRLTEVLMAVPGLILALALVAALGPGLTNAMLAVGIIMIPRFYRVSRAVTSDILSSTFVEGLRDIGCSSRRIIVRHVFPNALPALTVQVSIMLGVAVAAEASLSFLGFGVTPPTASWGSMLTSATDYSQRAPLLVVWPGVMIMLTVLGFALVGDGVRQAFSTRSFVEKGF
jgi:peptide/nickel transport system permease protein